MDTALILVMLYGGIALLCLRFVSRLIVGFVLAEFLALILGIGLVLLYADAGHGPSTFQTIFIVLFGMVVILVIYGANYLIVRWFGKKGGWN
jgi:hypothetical protein